MVRSTIHLHLSRTKPVLPCGRRHDLQHPLGGAACPADQPTAVGAVGPDPPQARHPPTTLLQQQATTGAILHAGRVDQQSVHQAEGVHQQMALAAFDQLAAIKAALEPTPLDRLHGLAVQDCGRWLRIAASGPTDIRSQVVVQLLPGAVVAPTTEVRPGSTPGDEVTRDHPPLSATPGHVADGIEDRT
jgi:hypothetical protein